jgi:prepilin-type N-terminal cleavage/methylation domain-containing protein
MAERRTSGSWGRRGSGFTLVEILVVVAIVAIIASLAAVSMSRLGRRGALQNAAFDLQGVLNKAHARASSRGFPIWVVFHPKAGRKAPTAGNGAYMVVEDSELALKPGSPAVFELELKEQGVVKDVYYLEDYGSGGQVLFDTVTPGNTKSFRAPFTGLPVQTCSFCTGFPPRGAILFLPEGGARFVDGTGQLVSTPNQSLTFRSSDGRQYLFAISGPASYIASFTP